MTPSTIDEIHVIVDNASGGGNWFSPFLSSLITVVSGVVVYIIGQYLFTIWVQPLQGYKEIRKRIAYCLTYYFEDYSNVRVFNQCTEETEIACLEGANEIRKLASELAGFSETISWIHFGIPSKTTLLDAREELIVLSNGFIEMFENFVDETSSRNRIAVKNIQRMLKIN